MKKTTVIVLALRYALRRHQIRFVRHEMYNTLRQFFTAADRSTTIKCQHCGRGNDIYGRIEQKNVALALAEKIESNTVRIFANRGSWRVWIPMMLLSRDLILNSR